MPMRKQNKYWLTFGLTALGAALMFLPFVVVDKGYFTYAGDFNSQMVPFQYYANRFLKTGGGSFSWATDLGSGFVNSYSYYLLGMPFFWLSFLFPAAAQPYLMVPMLVLKFAVAGAGAQLWMRRWVKDENLSVVGGCLYAFSGFTIYNVFFFFFVDAAALFPYLLWALDKAVLDKQKGWFAALVALNFLNNYFFFAGQVVFLALYFFCMLFSKTYRINAKRFWSLALESVLGCGMGCILALPALLFLADNPRTVSPFSGFDFLLYSQPQQYAAIVYNLFFPPDCPYMSVIFDKGAIKWTSLSAYLPLVSCAGVIAYLRCKQGTAFKRILYVCLFMACVPVLNSCFYAFNSSYYARWVYMPVLIMCLVTILALEDKEVQMEKGFVPTVLITLAFSAFALVPVKGETEADGWSMGVIEYPEKFWLNLGLALLGVAIFWLLWLHYQNRPILARRLGAAVLAFGCVMGVVHLSIGKFAQWEKDSNLRTQQYVDARALREQLPDDAYRIEAYGCYDNVGIWMDKSCIQCFHSTVAPSIMEFYPNLGVKRDVRSEPEAEMQTLRSLLGVRYAVCPEAKAVEFEKEYGNAWQRWGQQGQLVVYENTNALPMALAYEEYITKQEYDDMPESRRDELLLRALVLDEKQAEQYGRLFSHLENPDRISLEKTAVQHSINQRRTMSEQNTVELTRNGLFAEVYLEKKSLILLPVPYDKGFTAVVGGNEVPVLKVDGGLTAVPVPEGWSNIELTYRTPGLKTAFCIAGISLLLYVVYLAAGSKRLRERMHTKNKEK